jgi:arsenical pump membrane protein
MWHYGSIGEVGQWRILATKMLSLLLLLVVFAATCVALVSRPLRIGPGWWSVAGAGIAIATGLVSVGQAWSGLGATLNVLTFFGGLIILAAVVGRVGALEALLDRMEKWSGDSPRRLLLAVMAVTAGVTAIFSNDAAALLIAPSLVARLRARGLPPTPFVLAVAIVANSASLLLPVSNPVNLLLLDRDHIPLSHYLVQVTPAALGGLVLTALLIAAMSWRGLGRGPAPVLPQRSLDLPLLRLILALLVALAVVDLAFAVLGRPLGPPTLAAAGLGAAALWLRTGRRAATALIAAPWSLLPLVAGLSVLAAGLQRSQALGRISAVVLGSTSTLAAQLRVGIFTGLLAALVNNLPAAFLVSSGLAAAHHLSALAVPVIAGADLGPNLAPAGSLSTILIFAAVGGRGDRPSWTSFWRLSGVAGTLGLVSTLGLATLVR